MEMSFEKKKKKKINSFAGETFSFYVFGSSKAHILQHRGGLFLS